MGNPIPGPLMTQLIEEHGKNTQLWPSELQDLINPSIQARAVQAPQNGKIDKRLTAEFEFFWAKDVCGQNPDHSRVEGLRFDGWEYATTDDVKMANEFVVKGRNKSVKSKDGNAEGFSNEIRNGDLRLMKIPMRTWREIRKAHNMAALQTAYPRAYDNAGGPMSTTNMTPGMRSGFVNDDKIAEMANSRIIGNAAEELASGEIRSNTSVARVPKS
jgi:hypothetical protein